MLYNLEADTFINGLRRFISRRGTPCKIWSDNGTNFTAVDAEMSKNIQSMDKEVIQKYAVRCTIEWNFNPPSASHMGGVWERMIRTIRKVFTGLLDRNARLTDDILTTLFGEVESLINNRPLTKQSDDITDVGVLTFCCSEKDLRFHLANSMLVTCIVEDGNIYNILQTDSGKGG